MIIGHSKEILDGRHIANNIENCADIHTKNNATIDSIHSFCGIGVNFSRYCQYTARKICITQLITELSTASMGSNSKWRRGIFARLF